MLGEILASGLRLAVYVTYASLVRGIPGGPRSWPPLHALFEAAKRIYGLYLTHFTSVGSAGAPTSARRVLILWLLHAIVFLFTNGAATGGGRPRWSTEQLFRFENDGRPTSSSQIM